MASKLQPVPEANDELESSLHFELDDLEGASLVRPGRRVGAWPRAAAQEAPGVAQAAAGVSPQQPRPRNAWAGCGRWP
jgi:hypothetical protein